MQTFKVREDDQEKLKELVAQCRRFSGEYRRKSDPGFVSRYSEQFIEAATEICKLYARAGIGDLEFALFRILRSEGIHSCRGGVFKHETTEYLFQKHIRWRLEGRPRPFGC